MKGVIILNIIKNRMKKILNNDVSTLNLNSKIKAKLKTNNINTILELCNKSRMELAKFDLSNPEINDIAICLQLIGVDLKKNHAKRNTTIESK